MTITVMTPRANASKTTNGVWWSDLASTNDAAAAEFYGRVLGWTYDEMPIGEGMVHRNAKLGGLLVAGMDPVMPGSDMPSAWTCFAFVEDIAATVEAAKRLGATIIAEPMDVMGEGHMAVLQDPTGAAFGLWQPGRHTGADAVDQPGTMAWVELATDDVEAARRFYGELFGWDWKRQDSAEMEYWVASIAGRDFAGLMPKPKEMASMPSAWATYFGASDIEATAAEVAAAGGQVVFGPMQMGPGKGIGVVDPQGGYFVAFEFDEWPAA